MSAKDPRQMVSRALALASPANVVVEIGAYNGDDTYWLNRTARKPVRQFAFEPDPRNLDKIRRRGGVPAGVRLVQAAVGGASGRARFYQSSGTRAHVPGDGEWECSSSLRPPKDHLECFPWIKFDRSCEVDVVSLDDYFGSQGIDAIDFLWVDAQGAERDIVAGGERVLRGSRFIYLEHSEHEFYEGQWRTEEMLAAMDSRGWSAVCLFECDALLYNRNVYGTPPSGM